MATTLPRTLLANGDDFEAFANHLRGVENKTKRTADTYSTYARLFTTWLDGSHPTMGLDEVEADHIRAWLESQEQRGVTGDARRIGVYALRSFYKWRNRNTDGAFNPAGAVHPPRQPRLRTDCYSNHESKAILAHAAADTTLSGRFNHAVIATLRYTGLRNEELANLRTAHVDLKAADIYVIGKGRKARHIAIPPALVTILTAYLNDVRPQLPESRYLFASPRSQNNGCHIGRISPRSIHHTIERLGKTAEVPGRHYPHRWRHTYATGLVRNGVSLEHIRRLLGHANIATTAGYLHLNQDDLANAVNDAFADE